MRNKNWAVSLNKYIKECRNRPFEWGIFDCCIFTADCCNILCSVDPAEKYRGKYKTELGAVRQLKKNHGSIAECLDFYFDRIDLSLVQRGDVCVFDNEQGNASAVYFSGAWWSTTETGVARVDCLPLSVWRVD